MLVLQGKDKSKKISFAVIDAWPRPSCFITDEKGNTLWSVKDLEINDTDY
jgi:hypothetical protein